MRPIHRAAAGLIAAFCLLAAGTVFSQTPAPKPLPGDRCPVCGMFVAKYPDWIASVAFEDGSVFFFDGVKDLMKFYFDIKHYQPGRAVQDIEDIHVTDYYTGRPIASREAYFVVGSDVFGPMGKELIPFDSEAAASEFLQDHKGIRVLRFGEIRPTLIERLR